MARVGVSGGGKIETTILNNNKKFFLKSEKQKAKKDFESTELNNGSSYVITLSYQVGGYRKQLKETEKVEVVVITG